MRAIAAVFLIAFLITLTIFAIGTWSCNQPPKADGETQQAENARKEHCATFYGTFVAGLHDSGDFIHSYHQETVAVATVIIAIFTVILGLFTVSLAQSTRIAAVAAKVSADALIQAERAHVHIKILSQNFLDQLQKLDGNGHLGPDAKASLPFTVEYAFKNYGKTPAIIKEVNRDIILQVNFSPASLFIPVDLPTTERVLGSGDQTEPLKCMRTNLIVRELRDVIRAHSSLWFYGRITYDDIFGIGHEYCVIYRYNGSHHWRRVHDPKYSKNT
jgi:hypothetical protein